MCIFQNAWPWGKAKKKQQKNREQLSGKLGRPTKSHAYVLRMSNVGPVTQSSVGSPENPTKTPETPRNPPLPLACVLLMLITAVALRKALYPFKPQHICELANKLQA